MRELKLKELKGINYWMADSGGWEKMAGWPLKPYLFGAKANEKGSKHR